MLKIIKFLTVVVFICFTAVQAMADTSFEPRIIGGEAAADGELPFQVGIAIDNGSTYTLFCGGSLISDTWVLTAAHCLDDYTSSDTVNLRVLSGTNVWDQSKLTSVSHFILHESYDSVTYNNDIALIQLSSAVTSAPLDALSTTTTPRFTTGTTATVSGWGEQTAFGASDYPNELLKVDLPVVSNETCNQVASYNGRITDNMICAGFAEGGKDSCQGDSGGPLFVQSSDNTFTQIGVVSFGDGCAEPNKYGVYTKVANYEDWIESNTGLVISAEGSVTEEVTFTNINTATTLASENTDYNIDTNTLDEDAGSFTDSGDTVNFNTYVIGGEINSFTVSNSAETLELLYTTKAEINIEIDTDGNVDAAFVIQFPDGDANDYYLIRCTAGIGNPATCSRDKNVTYNTSGKWAMIYLDNNDIYDENPFGAASDSRALGDDRIDTTIYLARDYQASDVIDAVTGGGGGGCSASGSTAGFGLGFLVAGCILYILRRKIMQATKEQSEE